MLNKIVLLFTFYHCSLWLGVHSQFDQHYNGYNDTSCTTGGEHGFGMYSRYGYDLKDYFNNDNSAVALKGTGNWIFYDHAGYNGDSEIILLRGSCTPLQTVISRASSMKFAGDPNDYRAPSITIYQGGNYQGREVYVTNDNPKVLVDGPNENDIGYMLGGWSDKFGSLIITGNSKSCWTIYSAINYNAASTCICGKNSKNFAPVFVPNDPFPPYNRIGSVKKGCRKSVRSNLQNEFIRDGTLVLH